MTQLSDSIETGTCVLFYLFFLTFLFYIVVSQIINIVVISGEQQGDLAIHIGTCVFEIQILTFNCSIRLLTCVCVSPYMCVCVCVCISVILCCATFKRAYIFIYFYFLLHWVCVTMRGLFLQFWQQELLPTCSVQASCCGGFSCSKAQALGTPASVVVAHGLTVWLEGFGARAQLLCGMWDLPGPGIETVSCIARWSLNHQTTREALYTYIYIYIYVFAFIVINKHYVSFYNLEPFVLARWQKAQLFLFPPEKQMFTVPCERLWKIKKKLLKNLA